MSRPQRDLVCIHTTISGHQPTSKLQSPIERLCKIQDSKSKNNERQWLCVLGRGTRAYTHTHTPPLCSYLADPMNFRICIRGDASLRKVGVSTTPIIKSYGLLPVVWLNTPRLFSLSQEIQQTPPESSLESSDGENKLLLWKYFHHRLSNLETKGLLGCNTTLVLHVPASSPMQLCETTELWGVHRCMYEHTYIYVELPSSGANPAWNPHLPLARLAQII